MESGEVVKLVVGDARANASTIAVLEKLLERARAGEIISIGAVYETPNGFGEASSWCNDVRTMSVQLMVLALRGLMQ